MAATPEASDASDGPVLSLINKRIRGLRKKYKRILQIEESIAQRKPINKEQEEVLRSKPYVSASIEELEKLRQPLAAAVSEEISLAVQRHQVSASPSLAADVSESKVDQEKESSAGESQPKVDLEHTVVEDLLNLLYFGSLFDVKSQNDFTSTMLTRTHERGCCLTYDYVTDDEATDLLGERDLDLISMLGSLLISRPVDSSLSHKNALQCCVEHAMHWLSYSDQAIDSDPSVTYAGLRAKLNKIMASDYFITTPEMKAPVEMAAAAGGNYASFGSMVPVSVPIQVEASDGQYEHKDGDTTDYQANETYENQSGPVEEAQEGEFDSEYLTETPAQIGEAEKSQAEGQNEREVEQKEQPYVPRRNYQNQRGGRGAGGGRRGYPSGRGARGSSRGRGPYQNGRNQYNFEQVGNYYPRNYYNNRGRGARGGGGGSNFYNQHNNSSGPQVSNAVADS